MPVQLTWVEPNYGESSVKVYRSTSTIDPMSLPSPLATLASDSTSYLDTTAVDATTYYYRVSSTVNGTEYVSNEVTLTVDSPDITDLWDSVDGIWYDPSDLTTMFTDDSATINVATNGDAVAVIHDKSGNGNHGTQTSASSRPIYRTDGTYHWLEFNGTSRYFEIAATSWGDNVTIGCGEKKAVSDDNGFIFDCSTNTTFASSYGLRFDRHGGNQFRMGVSPDGSGAFVTDSVTTTDKLLLRGRYDGTTREIWRNRISEASSTSESGVIDYTGCTTRFCYSATGGGGDYYYNGNIYQFMLVSTALDTDDMDFMDDYIAWKTDASLENL